jgi:HEAT repeat protein
MNDKLKLLQQLQSDDAVVRHAAVKSIRDFPDDVFTEPLINLLKDESTEIRLSAIKTLGFTKSQKTYESLVALANDSNIVIKATVLAALGNLQDKRAFEFFANGLNDPFVDIRRASIKAVRKFKDKDAIELLSTGLKDSDAGVRRSAIEGLIEIDNMTSDNLSKALQDENVDIRLAGIKAVRKFKDQDTIELLNTGLKDSDVGVRRSAIEGLVEIDNITADNLSKALHDKDLVVRRTVIDNSEKLQDENVLELLVSALNDEDALIRSSSAKQIGDRFGGTRDAKLALEPLIKLMQTDKENNVRLQATWALGCIGDVRAISYLIPIAQSDNAKNVRSMAQNALGWIRDPAATNGLIPLLQDEDDRVRLNVIEALGKIRDPRAVNHVGLLLDDDAYEIRQSAAICLRKIGNKEAFITLANALLYYPNHVFRILHDWVGELPAGKTKAKYILQDVIMNNSNTPFQISPNLLFSAMLPVVQDQTEEQIQSERQEIIMVLLEEALLRKNDSRMVSIIADLLCFGAPGRDKAASLIEQYQRDFSVPSSNFELLRKYVGGERALEPILAQLRANLDDHFLEPIDSLNKTTFEMWDDTVKQAKRGFYTRLYMSIVIFVLGLIASSIALYQFSFGNIDQAIHFFGPGVTLLVGLASITATFYTGPLREIEKSVVDLGIIHTVFIGYIHTVLEISQTFAALVLQQKIDFSEMKKSNDLIKDSMTHTLGLLRPELKLKSEKVLDDNFLSKK